MKTYQPRLWADRVNRRENLRAAHDARDPESPGFALVSAVSAVIVGCVCALVLLGEMQKLSR